MTPMRLLGLARLKRALLLLPLGCLGSACLIAQEGEGPLPGSTEWHKAGEQSVRALLGRDLADSVTFTPRVSSSDGERRYGLFLRATQELGAPLEAWLPSLAALQASEHRLVEADLDRSAFGRTLKIELFRGRAGRDSPTVAALQAGLSAQVEGDLQLTTLAIQEERLDFSLKRKRGALRAWEQIERTLHDAIAAAPEVAGTITGKRIENPAGEQLLSFSKIFGRWPEARRSNPQRPSQEQVWTDWGLQVYLGLGNWPGWSPRAGPTAGPGGLSAPRGNTHWLRGPRQALSWSALRPRLLIGFRPIAENGIPRLGPLGSEEVATPKLVEMMQRLEESLKSSDPEGQLLLLADVRGSSEGLRFELHAAKASALAQGLANLSRTFGASALQILGGGGRGDGEGHLRLRILPR